MGFVFALVFIGTGAFVGIIMAISYFSVRLFNDSLHKTLCYILADIFWSIFPVFCLGWGGLELSIYGDPKVLSKWNVGHNIVVENHNYEIDFIVGYCVLYLANIIGSSKLVGKKILGIVPIQGPVWFFTDSLFIKRVWKDDERMIKDYVPRISKYPKYLPITLLFHPEGTRFTERKHVACVNYYKELGIEPLQYLLTPRMRGFKSIVNALRNNFDHLVDTTLLIRPKYEGYRISVKNLLLRKKFVAELYCNVYDMKDVPSEDQELGTFLTDSYYFKDKLMDFFHKNGSIAQKYDLLASSSFPNDLLYRSALIFFISFCYYNVLILFISHITGLSCFSIACVIFGGLYMLAFSAIQFLTVT